MRIAIPMAAGRLSQHFGHCERFALLDVDQAAKKILSKQELESPEHQPGLLPRWLAEKGATLIIAGGMGASAQKLFAESGIQVVIGAPVETPEVLAESFMTGTLQHRRQSMRPLNTVRSLRFTILVDDSPGDEDLRSAHGLSVWIEADHLRVLFDTGQGTTAMENARRLGLEPAEIDAVAISHGHDDHTGGLPGTLAACQKAHLFLHPAALRERYSRSADGTVRAAGFPLGAGELFATRKEYVHWTNAVTHLQPAVFMTGEIPRSTPARGARREVFSRRGMQDT